MTRPRANGGASAFWGPVLRGGIGNGLVQVFAMAATLSLTVLLARRLDVAAYGVYAYAVAVLNVLVIVSEVGVPPLLMREVAASVGAGNLRLIRGALMRGLQVVAGVSAVVAFVGAIILAVYLDHLGTTGVWTGAAMLAALPLAVLAKTLAHGVRGLHSVVWAQALETLLRPLLVVLLVGAVIAVRPDLLSPQTAMAAHVVAAGLVIVIAGYLLRRALPAGARTGAPLEDWSRWLRSVGPFAVIGSAMIVNSHVDIIMLGWFKPAADIGVYRIAAQGGGLTLFVLQAAQNVLAPVFGGMQAHKNDSLLRMRFRQVSLLVFLATLPIALVLVVYGEPIVTLVFGPAYAAAALPLAILTLGYFVSVSCGPVRTLLQMVGREGVTARTLGVTVVLNIFLNALLIPDYGVLGSALATAVSVVVYSARLRWIAYRRLGV